MPRLLFRFMLADLLRMAVLTCCVLLVVISFGAAIKPLSNDSLLSAGQAVKYITLAMVPMLQYALPFAAGFAGTMSMHRMTVTNEVLAAAASGIAYWRLLAPIAALGAVLAVLMVALTNSVIPHFWTMLERTIAEDITRLFQVTIARGEPFVYGDLEIYADAVHEFRQPEGTTADTRLVLVHVAAAIVDKAGNIDEDVTARQAVMDIERREGVTVLRMSMTDVAAFQHETGTLARTALIEPPPRVIPSVLRDDPKGMTRTQLFALDEEPDRYGPVISARHDVVEALRSSELFYRIDREFEQRGRLELVAAGPDRRLVVYGQRLAGGRVRGDVRVEQFENGVPTHAMTAGRVEIERRPTGPLGTVAVDLVLTDYEVTDLRAGTVNRRARVSIENLGFDLRAADELTDLSSAELLARVEASPAPPSGTLKRTSTRLERKIRELRLEIRSRLARRYALSVTPLLLLLLGTTLAMWLRSSLPLTIYLWAFLPSIVNLILIESGEHVMRDGHVAAGAAVMWAGNAGIVVVWLMAYFRLARN